MKKNQLLRAFRVDKLTLASVEATLIEYLDFETMKTENPTIRMITEDAETVKKRCQKLQRKIQKIDGINAEIVESEGKIGGGSYPLDVKKTYSVKITDTDIHKLESHLRLSEDHIISTVHDGALYLNALTIFDRQIDDIYQTVKDYYEK